MVASSAERKMFCTLVVMILLHQSTIAMRLVSESEWRSWMQYIFVRQIMMILHRRGCEVTIAMPNLKYERRRARTAIWIESRTVFFIFVYLRSSGLLVHSLYPLVDGRVIFIWIKTHTQTPYLHTTQNTSKHRIKKNEKENIKRNFSSDTKYYNKVILLSSLCVNMTWCVPAKHWHALREPWIGKKRTNDLPAKFCFCFLCRCLHSTCYAYTCSSAHC